MSETQPAICGKELTKIDDCIFALPETEVDAIFEEAGISKETRNTIDETENRMIEDAFDVCHQKILENGDPSPVYVRIGQGNNQTFISVNGKAECSVKDPESGEIKEEVRYGIPEVTERRQFPASNRESRLRQIQADCERAFS